MEPQKQMFVREATGTVIFVVIPRGKGKRVRFVQYAGLTTTEAQGKAEFLAKQPGVLAVTIATTTYELAYATEAPGTAFEPAAPGTGYVTF